MSTNISTNAAYIVSISDATGAGHEEAFDSVAQGLVIREDRSRPEGAWGTASWFDKAATYMHMVMIQKAPIIKGSSYTVLSQEGVLYSFQLITKAVYDAALKRLLPEAPDVTSDEEAQQYVCGLNPYGNTGKGW